MAVRLILPLLIASLSTGETLAENNEYEVWVGVLSRLYSLRRVRRVDNDSIFALLVGYQVGVVVATPYPCSNL